MATATGLLMLMAALLCIQAQAGNPLVPYAGMADPNVRLMNGTFFAWATHDFSINNTGFLMKDWFVWSSPDLVKWTIESYVRPAEVFPWSTPDQRNECWATDAATRNNKYYFYVSVGGSSVAVAVADSPAGPWSDPLGKPLLETQPGSTWRDPAVFEDDDGSFYLIAGVFNYYIARLNEDMVSLNETLKHVAVMDPYGPCGANVTDDKPFLHKHNGTYYLSWGCFYATSTSVYGPYQTRGSVVDTAKIAPDFRMPPPAAGTPWYRGEDYTDRHGSFLEANGQWYFAANDRSHSGDVSSPGSFRDTVMGYIHFRDDGTMDPIEINSAGVGSYDAASLIQAENYFSHKLCRKLDRRHLGFAVAVPVGGELRFPHVFNLPPTLAPTLVLHTTGSSQSGVVTVVSEGQIVGQCQFPGLISGHVRCPLQLEVLSEDFELVLRFSSVSSVREFEGAGEDLLILDSFNLV